MRHYEIYVVPTPSVERFYTIKATDFFHEGDRIQFVDSNRVVLDLYCPFVVSIQDLGGSDDAA